MDCSNCGAQLGSGNFCASCGAPSQSLHPNHAQLGQASTSPQWQPYAATFQAPPQSPSKAAAAFALLGRVSLALSGFSFFLTLISPMLFPGFEFSQLVTFNVFALVVLMLTAVLFSVLRGPTWSKWLITTVLFGLYWVVVRPLVAYIQSSDNGYAFELSEYEFSAPLVVLFDMLAILDTAVEVAGWPWIFAYLGSLLIMQFAPTLAVIAVLGASIANKRLS